MMSREIVIGVKYCWDHEKDGDMYGLKDESVPPMAAIFSFDKSRPTNDEGGNAMLYLFDAESGQWSCPHDYPMTLGEAFRNGEAHAKNYVMKEILKRYGGDPEFISKVVNIRDNLRGQPDSEFDPEQGHER